MSTKPNIQKDFPLLSNAQEKGKKFVYLDSAATSQKPHIVIDAEKEWYETYNANVHRGAYKLAEQATKQFETVRGKVSQFIGAQNPKSIVFTRGTTEGINLVVQSWAKHNLQKGDTILLTEMEHHANIVPWQLLAEEMGLKIRYWPIDENGNLCFQNSPLERGTKGVCNKTTNPSRPSATPPQGGDQSWYDDLFNGVKVASLAHVSNVLGTINPLLGIITEARKRNIRVVVDGAQAAPHMLLDMDKLQPDFYIFSAHKMLGPTGVGVVYVHPDRFKEMHPYQGGGEMIREVTKDGSTYKPMPWLLEAGTMPLAQVYAFGAALDYLSSITMERVRKHDELLVKYAYEQLSTIPKIITHGPAPEKRLGLISFTIQDMHAHDIATLLDEKGVAMRAGHHCAMPLHTTLGVSATARMSFNIYNTREDVDYAISSLKEIIEEWRKSSN